MMDTSIRVRLLVLTLAGIGVVWAAALLLSYVRAAHEVGEWDDARLVQLARVLVQLDAADLSILAAQGVEAQNEYPRHGRASNTEDSDKLPRKAWFLVTDGHGVVAASPQLAKLGVSTVLGGEALAPRSMSVGGEQWRAYAFHDDATGRTVQVFERANVRSDLMTGVARRIARPIFFSLPVIALLVWISISRSLVPLKTLSDAISTRDANRLEPIDVSRAPGEVRPLVDAINHLLDRLHRSLLRERAFTADAAHELKTPLAAIKVQAQIALTAGDVAQQRLAMERVVHGVDRSTHLAQQLLMLARLDESEKRATQCVSLTHTARTAVLIHRDSALRKMIHLALIEEASPDILADPTLMSVLLANLLDNAIKYGGAGGTVELVVGCDERNASLTVRDDGPGVAAEDRWRLTDRFFRVVGNRAGGSGLGLSIVARIAQYFDAQLSFGAGIGGRGLAVRVVFPIADAHAEPETEQPGSA
jgi:two-component system sensor histidine kinase QseC